MKKISLSLSLALIVTMTAKAWDTEPDAEGLYDGLYDRPTYFPEWQQPDAWENAMYILCDVREESASGKRVESYEVAVYDRNDELRHCGRSLPRQDHYCVLTIRGEDGVDEFHFQVLYGEDFVQPEIVDIADVTVPFVTNMSIGTTEEPFLLLVPQEHTGVESVQQSAVSSQKILRDGMLLIIRNGRMYNAQGSELYGGTD